MYKKKIVLAGNPNVGKSTIFNSLTGLHQHTGNWSGKTVSNACGEIKKKNYLVYDLPGTYSLIAHSKEEEIARDFIYSEDYNVIVVVCDAVCLERNLNLVLQILEITNKVIVCVNLLDEAKKKNISIDLNKLEIELGVKVIGTNARKKEGLNKLLKEIDNFKEGKKQNFKYSNGDEMERIKSISRRALEISKKVVKQDKVSLRDRKIDKILISKKYGIPIMMLLLLLIFWITIVGANIPSEALYNFFTYIEDKLLTFLNFIHTPKILLDVLVYGVYRVLTWVVSVMLPPMAIFFPLFALLEDLGYLPRIAFNLDKFFNKCKTCGKQALTMCMGFGCNAAGVTGARIIDSPRERLIAILTNSFVPCNGRFPSLIAIITIFFVGLKDGIKNSLIVTLILGLIIFIGVVMTFLTSKILSCTFLKGVPSSFVLELPPYRNPQIVKTIIRSIFDKIVFILGRAILIAAPAGLIIWILANFKISSISLLEYFTNFLEPIGNIMGLDGVILMAFILGFPANEIVIPLMLMGYMQNSTISETSNLFELKKILVQNGWTYITAINFMIFSLFHFPCSTTVLTIKKETGSFKWTIFSVLFPTLIGFIICTLITLILK